VIVTQRIIVLLCHYQEAVNPVSGKSKGHVLKSGSQTKSRGWRCVMLWSLDCWFCAYLWLYLQFH